MSKFEIIDYKPDIPMKGVPTKIQKRIQDTFWEPSLRKEVNKFDKMYGINLKEPDVWAMPFIHKQIDFADAEKEILALICMVNGLRPTDFIDVNSCGMPGTKFVPHNKSFIEYSVLDWNSKKTRDMRSLGFKCMYTTLLLSRFVDNLPKIARRMVKCEHSKPPKSDQSEIMTAKKISKDACRFAFIMASKHKVSYSGILVNMLVYLTYKYRDIDYALYNKTLIDHVIYSRKYAQKDAFIRKPYHNEDETIEAVFHTAFILASGDVEDVYGYIPDHKHFKGVTRHHNTIKLIEALGAAILASKQQSDFADGYLCFRECRPQIFTEHKRNADENRAIKEGIYALAYANFVYEDREMHKLITELLKKGK